MRLGERLGELAYDPVGIDAFPVRNLDQPLDLVLAAVGGIEMDAELGDLLVLADDRLDRARIDVRPSNQFHVIDPAANAALIEVEGAATGAAAGPHPHPEVAGAITQHRDEPAAKRRDQSFAQLTVADGLAGLGVDDLFDVEV